MTIDYHVHTPFSDGRASLYEVVKEAKDNGFSEIGVVDHCSPVDPDVSHEGRFWDQLESDVREGPEYFSDNYELRNEALLHIVEEDPDVRMASDGYGLGRNALTELEDSLSEQLIVWMGAEIDYNPRIESVEDEIEYRNEVASHEQKLQEFIDEASLSEEGFDYLLGSVHYVNREGEPLYVKLEEPFEGMSIEGKRSILDDYFEKLGLLIDSDLFDIVAHPSLPERNNELMSALLSEGTRKMLWSQNINEYKGSGVDRDLASLEREYLQFEEQPFTRKNLRDLDKEANFSEDVDRAVKDYFDLMVSDEEALEERNRELEEYYRKVVERLKNSHSVPEINGKGVERQKAKSPLWEMVQEFTKGSDAHRRGEMSDRDGEFESRDIENFSSLRDV